MTRRVSEMTPDEHAASSQEARTRWAAMTPEHKEDLAAAQRERRSYRERKRYAEMTPEQKDKRLLQIHKNDLRIPYIGNGIPEPIPLIPVVSMCICCKEKQPTRKLKVFCDEICQSNYHIMMKGRK